MAQLNAGAKDRCQILDQLAEVHTAIRREIKQNLIEIKCIFDGDQLHIQLVLRNFLFANRKGFLCALLIGLYDLFIRMCGNGNFSIFYAPRRLNDDMLSHRCLDAARVKIIYFSDFFESDAYNLSQICSSYISPKRRNALS